MRAALLVSVNMLSAIAWLFTASLAIAKDLPSYERVRVLQAGEPLKEVALLDTSGAEYSLSDMRGTVAFVFFGFTNCADVCPAAMQRFRQLQQSGKLASDRVAFVLISVDGERDTPAVMKDYLAGFSADFVGLTGDPKAVKRLAKQFRAPFYKDNGAGSKAGYSVAHSPQSFIIDTEGALRAEFYNASFDAMAGIANALLDAAEPVARADAPAKRNH
jgi:protein SCO1/2